MEKVKKANLKLRRPESPAGGEPEAPEAPEAPEGPGGDDRAAPPKRKPPAANVFKNSDSDDSSAQGGDSPEPRPSNAERRRSESSAEESDAESPEQCRRSQRQRSVKGFRSNGQRRFRKKRRKTRRRKKHLYGGQRRQSPKRPHAKPSNGGTALDRKKRRMGPQKQRSGKGQKVRVVVHGNPVDIGHCFVRQSELTGDQSPFRAKSAPQEVPALRDHSEDFRKVLRPFSGNKDFNFSALELACLSRATFVRLQNFGLCLAAESPAHPAFQSRNPKLKLFRQTFDSGSNKVDFHCLLSERLPSPVCKLALNEDQDLLAAGLADSSVLLFFLRHRAVSVGGNTFDTTLSLEPVSAPGIKGQRFCPGATTILHLNPFQVRPRPDRAKYVQILGGAKFAMDKSDHLALFNEANSSLEVFSISDLDCVTCCLRYRLGHLERVSSVVDLNSSWVALSCSTGTQKTNKHTLATLHLLNGHCQVSTWAGLGGVREVAYDSDNHLLFVASDSGTLFAARFENKDGALTLLGSFKVGAGPLSLKVLRSKESLRRNRLVVLDGSDHMYSYTIHGSSDDWESFAERKQVLCPVEMAELPGATLELIDLHQKNRHLLAAREGTGHSRAVSVLNFGATFL